MTFCRYKERLILLTYWHPETSLLIHRGGAEVSGVGGAEGMMAW